MLLQDRPSCCGCLRKYHVETLGKGTLLLYLGNGLFQTIATKLAYSIIPSTTYISCLIIHLVAYLLCIVIGFVAVKII